ncbi:zinc finger MYM-type protein 1-like [Rhopalosiphum maidis]|uniref:zinc finger MYM-type protein 1-like n=1 Tax=Rhopalosiphum maidis TaxID=43146 RepID=UPI000EFE47BF|nr:zinc finger MYM-type protein 1-like [Rhopalosiphum maidis]
MKQRTIILERIDQQLIHQMQFENNYWKTILKRIVAVKVLSSRGLPFRGETTQIGCSNNGNFLMAIELIAEFDVVLSEHIQKYGNLGKCHTSYLSFHTYEQFILLMADNVVNNIIREVNEARYFSISIDSTPDISHTDQLSFIIHCVNVHGEPVERFLCFINNIGHKSQEMMEAVIHIFKKYNLNTNYLRGQSYDNTPLENFKCVTQKSYRNLMRDILERFNACSKKLQSIQIDLGIVVEIYQLLIGFVHDVRCDDMFNDYKTQAIEKCGISSLKYKY